jgi:hypothetical protein
VGDVAPAPGEGEARHAARHRRPKSVAGEQQIVAAQPCPVPAWDRLTRDNCLIAAETLSFASLLDADQRLA